MLLQVSRAVVRFEARSAKNYSQLFYKPWKQKCTFRTVFGMVQSSWDSVSCNKVSGNPGCWYHFWSRGYSVACNANHFQDFFGDLTTKAWQSDAAAVVRRLEHSVGLQRCSRARWCVPFEVSACTDLWLWGQCLDIVNVSLCTLSRRCSGDIRRIQSLAMKKNKAQNGRGLKCNNIMIMAIIILHALTSIGWWT